MAFCCVCVCAHTHVYVSDCESIVFLIKHVSRDRTNGTPSVSQWPQSELKRCTRMQVRKDILHTHAELK